MLEGFGSRAATFTADVDQAIYINFVLSIVLFLSVVAPMLYFAWKYRESNVKDENIENIVHHTGLEITWTVIPTLMLAVFFWYGYTSMRTLRTMPDAASSITVQVEGKKWSWNYTYPANANGYVHKTAELFVPVDQNIILEMGAPLNDVIHSYFVPAFRMKEDVVPGRLTKQWFNSTVIGNYDVECAEYCGTRHSYMLSKIHVIDRATYDAWFNSDAKAPAGFEVAMSKGQEVFEANGCNGCHSVADDSILVGPSLMGIGEKKDAQYIKDALATPDKVIAEGFSAGIMTPYTLSEEDMTALIQYLKDGK